MPAFRVPVELGHSAGVAASLDLLNKLGITSIADSTSRLSIADLLPETHDKPEVRQAATQRQRRLARRLGPPGNRSGKEGRAGGGNQGKRSPGQIGGRPFISYVGTHPDEEKPDPDGLDQATRMRIEEQAIDLIPGLEPSLRRTPDGNSRFDLYEVDGGGKPVRWVEVKSMTCMWRN